MAQRLSGYDGSVVINTQLDNSGFDKGSKELEAAIRELSSTVKNMGAQMQQTFGQYTQAIEQAVQSTGNMGRSMGSAKAQTEGLGDSVRNTQTAVDDLRSSGTGEIVDFERPKQKASELSKEISSLSKKVDSLSALQEKANSGDGKASQRAAAKLKVGYDQACQSLDQLDSKLDAFGQKEFPTEKYKRVNAEIEKMRQKLAQLDERKDKMDALGVDKESKAYKSLAYDIDLARKKLEGLQQEKAEYERDGEAFTMGVDTKEFDIAATELQDIRSELLGISRNSKGALTPPNATGWQKAGQVIKNAAKATAKGAWAGLKWITTNAAKAGASLAKMGGKAIASRIKKTAASVLHLGKSVKSSKGGMAGGLKAMLKYGLGIRSIYALVNKLRTALVKGWQGMAGYDSKFNGVMSEFIGSLKQLGNAFAAAFAPILNVVLPILTTFINAMSEAINKFGMMIATLTGQKSFIKATKVQYDYAKASGTASDELDEEGKSAKETKKQLMGFDQVNILSEDKDKDKDKDKNGEGGWETVPVDDEALGWADALKQAWENADFTNFGRMLGEKIRDALNSIPWDSIKNTMRKIGKSLATFLNGILETPGLFDAIGRTLAQGINSAFEILNAFIQNFHWTSLGQAIKDGILGFCNAIDWPLIYATFSGAGAGIGAALQSGFNNPEIWVAMLTFLSNGINALTYGLLNFLAAVDWGSMGMYISNGLNAAVMAIDWNAISQTLIAGFNGLFGIWLNMVATFDFWQFGNVVGKCISDAINGIDWFSGAYSIGLTITGLFEAFNGFVEGVDWAMIGREVIDLIAGFFVGLDWGTFGTTLSDCCKGLFDFLTGAIEEINWDEIGTYICTAISDLLKNFDWKGTAESVGRLIGAALKSIVKAGTWLIKTLWDVGTAIWNGGLEGILKGVKGILSWLKKNVLDPFIQGFKDAFGIHSPSKEMEPLGGFIIEGLLQGIKNTWNIITNFFGNCGQTISNIFNGLGQWWDSIGSNIVSGIQNGIAGAWQGLCNTVSGWCSDLWDTVTGFFQIGSPSKLMRDTVGKWIPLGVAEGIKKTSDSAIESVRAMAQSMADEADSSRVIIGVGSDPDDPTSGLDRVLNIFSDKVMASFQNLLSGLERLVSGTGFMLPAMATGSVAPYSTRSGGSGSTAQDIANAIAAASNGMNPEELRSMLEKIKSAIEGTSFYIGDQDLARHVNKGNNVLDRRYKPG